MIYLNWTNIFCNFSSDFFLTLRANVCLNSNLHIRSMYQISVRQIVLSYFQHKEPGSSVDEELPFSGKTPTDVKFFCCNEGLIVHSLLLSQFHWLNMTAILLTGYPSVYIISKQTMLKGVYNVVLSLYVEGYSFQCIL